MFCAIARLPPADPDAVARTDSYSIDTSNILFILSGAFVGLDTLIKRRMAKGVSPVTTKIICATRSQFVSSPLVLQQTWPNNRKTTRPVSCPSSRLIDEPFLTPSNLWNPQVCVTVTSQESPLTYSFLYMFRSGQVWVHSGVHFSTTLLSHTITTDTPRLAESPD